METDHLAKLLRQKTPAHFRDICGALSMLGEELEYTKAALSNDLMTAQNNDDYVAAREILDAQEEILHKVSAIHKFLKDYEDDDSAEVEQDVNFLDI